MKTIRIITILALGFFLLAACEKEEEEKPAPYMESFADVEECLSFTPLKSGQPGPNQSCIHYSYDGDSTLEIIHYNSGFNCCPEKILTSFEIRNDTIFIVENDSLRLCRCNCLFNVEMTIHNLHPGQYVLKIDEPYVPEKEQTFLFNMILEKATVNQVCIDREFYPWQEL